MDKLPEMIERSVNILLQPFVTMESVFFGGWWLIFFAFGWAVFFGFQPQGKQNRIKHTFRSFFDKDIWCSRTFFHDVVLYIANRLTTLIVFATQYYYIRLCAPKVAGFFELILGAREIPRAYPGPFETVCLGLGIVLAFDVGWTLLHYASHKIPFLWQFHKVHHSARRLNPISVLRFHPLERIILTAGPSLCMALAVGMILYVYADWSLAKSAHNLFVLFAIIGIFRHSEVWISFGPVNYILSSPAMHQIHHSRQAKHTDMNMCVYFPFLDALLGTLYVPKTKEELHFGLNDDDSDWTVVQLFMPWRHPPGRP